jgi:hypothetical protein
MVQATTDENGVTKYTVAPLAETPTSELSQKERWEGEFVHNLSRYVKLRRDAPPESPLIRDLLRLDPRRIQDYTEEEKRELLARIERAMSRCPDKFKLKLMWLKAECWRHLNSPVSADDLYQECATLVLAQVNSEPQSWTMSASTSRLQPMRKPSHNLDVQSRTSSRSKIVRFSPFGFLEP